MDKLREPPRERHALALDADQCQPLRSTVLLDDLVRHTCQGAPDLIAIHDLSSSPSCFRHASPARFGPDLRKEPPCLFPEMSGKEAREPNASASIFAKSDGFLVSLTGPT
jgi:hypothetical protein